MATLDELLQAAKWRRALAEKARELARDITDEPAHRALLRHAEDLERQADEAEAQADSLASPS